MSSGGSKEVYNKCQEEPRSSRPLLKSERPRAAVIGHVQVWERGSRRNKAMADGLGKSLQSCLSPEMERVDVCVWSRKKRKIVLGRWQKGRPFLC